MAEVLWCNVSMSCTSLTYRPWRHYWIVSLARAPGRCAALHISCSRRWSRIIANLSCEIACCFLCSIAWSIFIALLLSAAFAIWLYCSSVRLLLQVSFPHFLFALCYSEAQCPALHECVRLFYLCQLIWWQTLSTFLFEYWFSASQKLVEQA